MTPGDAARQISQAWQDRDNPIHRDFHDGYGLTIPMLTKLVSVKTGVPFDEKLAEDILRAFRGNIISTTCYDIGHRVVWHMPFYTGDVTLLEDERDAIKRGLYSWNSVRNEHGRSDGAGTGFVKDEAELRFIAKMVGVYGC